MLKVLQLFALWCALVMFFGSFQSSSEEKRKESLAFEARPKKTVFKRGEDIVLSVSLNNSSNQPTFVSRLKIDDFVDVDVKGPDGKPVPWEGRRRIDSKVYDPADFVILKPGEKLNANRIISLKDGQGFLLKQAGRYSVTAQYSLGPPEYFAPLAGSAHIPVGTFLSSPTSFCVETCNPSAAMTH